MLSLWNDWNSLRRRNVAGELQRAFSAFDELRTELDRAFGRRDPWFGFLPAFTEGPDIDFSDQGDTLTLTAELPGLSEKDVEVSVNANTLTLRGERKVESPKGYSVHRNERQSYRFERSYTLPSKIDVEHVRAVMKNGVLTLTLPKAPEAQPKHIAVKAA